MTREELRQYISENFEGKITILDSGRYDLMVELKAVDLVEISLKFRDDDKLKFDYFCNLGGVDTGERFEAVYSVASISLKQRLDFKVILPYDQAKIDSVQKVWPAANWFEREMWELYGIEVNNHDNLTRFLLPDDWDEGFPMRKDWDAPDFKRLPEL